MKQSTTQRLCNELQQRRVMGLSKYGTTLEDAGLSRRALLQHAKEEALDLAEYLQTCIDIEDADKSKNPDWPKSNDRIDNIATNGNDGLHYEFSTDGKR